MRKLSLVRRVLATFALVWITLYFINPSVVDLSFFNSIFEVQIVPAILSASVSVLLALLVITLLFGRSYCSLLCPLGIFQDVLHFFNKRRINKNKKMRKKRRKYQYEEPQNFLRYGILSGVIVVSILGSSLGLIVFDPYSIYGRFATNILRPIGVALNNVMAHVLNAFDNYTFVVEEYAMPSYVVMLATVLVMAIIVVMVIKKDRFWCNAICPVGTLLGIISKKPLFRVQVDKGLCESCKKCAYECKSHAIDSKTSVIDYSRCVACYGCINSCNEAQAMSLCFGNIVDTVVPEGASKKKRRKKGKRNEQ